MASTPLSKLVTLGGVPVQPPQEGSSTHSSDESAISVNQEKTEYVLTSVNLHRQWQHFGISQDGAWKEIKKSPYAVMCDKITCDTVCDSINCGAIWCDKDYDKCDKVCDSLCDDILCDQICDKIKDFR